MKGVSLILLYAWSMLSVRAWDPTFDVQLTRYGWIEEAVVQADGKILVRGEFQFVAGKNRPGLARLEANGALDESFVPEIQGIPLALATIGKETLVLQNLPDAGGARLRKLDAAGKWDQKWELRIDRPISGRVRLQVEPDGSILAFGANLVIDGKMFRGMIRVQPDGTWDEDFVSPPDASFGSVMAVVREPEGTYLVASGKLHRLAPNGELLRTFDFHFVRDVHPLRDGKYLLAGSWLNAQGAELLRINRDGIADPEYAFTRQISGAFLAPIEGGRLVVRTDKPLLLDSNGEFLGEYEVPSGTTSFGAPLFVRDSMRAFAVQNGKILVSSVEIPSTPQTVGFGLMRLHENFRRDETFRMPGGVMRAHGGINHLAVNAAGAIYVSGVFEFVNGIYVEWLGDPTIVKLDPAGNLDVAFTLNLLSQTNPPPETFALEGSGSLIVPQLVHRIGEAHRPALFRLHPDGTPMEMLRDAQTCERIVRIAPLQNGAFVLARKAGGGGNCIVLDHRTFHSLHDAQGRFVQMISAAPHSLFPEPINFIVPVGRDRLLIGGQFTSVNGAPRTNAARMKLNGEIDNAFATEIPVPSACVILDSNNYLLLCSEEPGQRSELIRVDASGEIVHRAPLANSSRIKKAFRRNENEIAVISGRCDYSCDFELSIISPNGELLRTLQMPSINLDESDFEPEFPITQNPGGSMLVAGKKIAATDGWSGIRRLSDSEVAPFILRLSLDQQGPHLQLRSPRTTSETFSIRRSSQLECGG